ncbi:MAG TPA: MerR family transcriptional regulator [Candidatus Acidoferrum sp.]|nr:MerR family transcriptional regulator [Candidatus Acidoferrum sp.]
MTERALFIGKVAQHAKVNPGTIRYYEAIGLLPKPQRGQNRYRVYSADAVEMLQFIRKAQGLGLRLSEIQELVEVRRTGREPCGHMQALAERKIDDLDWKLEELATLRKNLKDLLSRSKRQRAQGYEKGVVCPHIEGLPFAPRPREQTRWSSRVSRKDRSPAILLRTARRVSRP